jgi:YesN/AraC family two-component response regulator
MKRKNDPIDFILHRIETYLTENKPYLQSGFTIKKMSNDIQIPAYQISAVINHRKEIGFIEYINGLRIKHGVALIKSHPDKKIDLQQLATACGFQNIHSFSNAFTKFTGITLSEYCQQL